MGKQTRYIIIGAGAVGGAIGARLFEAGHRVTLVARGAHRAAIAKAGLEFITPSGSRILPIPVIDGPEGISLTADDVLILAVKTQDSIAALDAWSGRILPDGRTAGQALALVCAQNGVEAERLAARRFAGVYGMCVFLPATFVQAGTIVAAGDPLSGVLTVGRFPSGTDRRIEEVADDLSGASFRSTAVEKVMPWKYAKLLTNLGNALEAVCGPIADDEAEALMQQVSDEGAEVVRAAGIETVDPNLEAAERSYLTIHDIPGQERGGGSSWQSLTRGTGSIETDYLSGEIVLLGRLHGIATPANLVLQIQASESARIGAPPGRLRLSQVRELIAGQSMSSR